MFSNITPIWTYFELEEFNCNCCGKNGMSNDFITKLNHAREMSGTPFYITSGYRCNKHQKLLYTTGVSTALKSRHQDGIACDIYCVDSSTRFKIIHSLLAMNFTRIGIGRNFIHVDDDKNLTKKTWLY